MKRRIGYVVALLGLGLGILAADSGAAASGSREVAKVQEAIAAEGLEWQAALTPLSLLDREERLRRLGGLPSAVPHAGSGERVDAGLRAVPAQLDWRDHGGNWITSVKDQGNCGSCWAFATTALLEAMVKISKKMTQDIDLSEQMLVSCSGAGNCAQGGYEYLAAEYIQKTGIPRESCYPYLASDTPCNPCAGWGAQAVRIESWNWVTPSTAGIEAALQDGPVTSWMAVYSDFFHYRSGVYQPTAGASYQGGHFVVIVGYSLAGRYWIGKNSWGGAWGEDGFFRIRWGASGIGSQVLRMVRPLLDNAPPVLQAVPDCATEEGRTMAFTLIATDDDEDALEFSADDLPEGAVLDPSSGAFAWTPSFTQSGAYSVRFRVTDGLAEDSQTVALTVTDVKRVPWAAAPAKEEWP